MSRIAYFDCASGASGDMLLGALVDLGWPMGEMEASLAMLPLRGYRLESRKVHRSGLHATKVDVIVAEESGHDHGHAQESGHHHHHRGLRDILGLLHHSGLDAEVRERCVGLFRRLAEAEASVHGTSPDEVHFHEVGAVDSIVDIVGGVCGLRWLGALRFVASPLNVGTGTVSMSHGVYPVPPPATARLVQGASVYGAGEGELLTPTGALLVTSYAQAYGPLPAMRPLATGHGAGTRDTAGRPNVLRLIVGEDEGEGEAAPGTRVMVLEAEVDDASPQMVAFAQEKLLAAGALDAYVTPIVMKKGRSGLLVTVLAAPDRRLALEEILFRETTTLGVRRTEWERTMLDRETVRVDTAYGPVGVKLGRRGSEVLNAHPEFEDCRRAADAAGVSVKEVWSAALVAYRLKKE